MIQNTTNILDQLLGGLEAPPTGSQTGTSSTDAGMVVPFGDLLGLLVNGREIAASMDVEAAFTPQDTPALDGEAVETTVDTAALAALVARSIAGLPEMQMAVPGEAEATDQAVVDESSSGDTQIPSIDSAAFKAFDTVSLNPNIKALFSQSSSQLESAVYKVLDARIEGGNLELTVAGDSATGAPVRISVPAELLRQPQQIEMPKSAGVEKAELRLAEQMPVLPTWDGSAQTSLQVDELLSRLNLKALEIRLEPTTSETAAAPSKVAVNLVAEMGGQQLILKNKLDSQKIDIKKTDNSRGTAQPQPGQSSLAGGKALTGVTPTHIESQLSSRTVAVPSKNISAAVPFDLVGRLAGGTGKPGSQQAAVAGDFALPQSDTQAKTPDLGLPQVRLYLPEQFQPQLRSANQTLMLKIEPESLGPAKLNLVMRQDVLTARVTVETPLAKAAVEGSLDQLTQQLARAGVQVQRIDVALDGGGMRNQFFDRRPEWSSHQGQTSARNARESESEQVTSSTVFSWPVNEYLRIDGVNLLA
jgi:flagellar hook-length control protein FliK